MNEEIKNENAEVVEELQETDTAIAVKGDSKGLESFKAPSINLSNSSSAIEIWTNPQLLSGAMECAKVLAYTNMVPGGYQKQPSNCLIAIDFAYRMGISPLTVMNNLDIIQGNPAWRGQACIALVNNCGRFKPIKFEEWHNDDFSDYYCIAYAEETKTGDVLKSTKIDKALADSCGWTTKSNSYWKKMPMQMARYRAAAFFARAYCPEALMGLYTSDEQRDINQYYDDETVTKTYKKN